MELNDVANKLSMAQWNIKKALRDLSGIDEVIELDKKNFITRLESVRDEISNAQKKVRQDEINSFNDDAKAEDDADAKAKANLNAKIDAENKLEDEKRVKENKKLIDKEIKERDKREKEKKSSGSR